ncbi:MAG: hypothetical protein PHN66_03470 [Candidatus Shapirobacteria bacterium]|nr:hypothetical protein [Candidatus Shapirobacteria bacterium]
MIKLLSFDIKEALEKLVSKNERKCLFVKKIGILLTIILILSLSCIGAFLVNFLFGPRTVDIVPGWQKMSSINGVIPKGSILIASVDSNLVLPGDDQIKQSDGFISRGVVIFNEKKYVISKGAVWIYVPKDYEFLIKSDNLLLQCDEKMSDLTGGTIKRAENMYFVGHP